MSSWKFRKETGADGLGGTDENAAARQKTVGEQPFFNADSLASKRNVIATPKGWVRRQNYTDMHGNPRTKDELLVAAHPGTGTDNLTGYIGNTHMSNPNIAQIYTSPNLTNGVTGQVYVVFNTPVVFQGATSGNNLTIDTAGAAVDTMTCIANVASTLINANNTVVFDWTPSSAGNFTIESQDITVVGGGDVLYNPDEGETSPFANLHISGATSNALGTIVVSA